ncbi:MAG: glutathione S-transferase family protein [Pseudomonadota bacterium]
MSSAPLTLYGVSHSLYTGRARSYLIKAGIPYREQPPNTARYKNHVLPNAGGRRGIPVIELDGGDVIRDGAAIIDHFEAASGHTFSPATPKQRFFSRLFDAIGAEGLLRPAMHYRWNFDEDNLDFLMFHFQMIMPPGEIGAEMAKKSAGQMRQAAMAFGVNPDNYTLVEALYADQLAAMDRHFKQHGYLLGGRPTIGDFGLLAPMFGHLGRDPKPMVQMQRDAKHVFRWVERMNRVDPDLVEFTDKSETYLADDQIPDTLIDLLRAMAEDFVPETLAAADCINAWLADQSEITGTECARGVGFASFEVRGTQVSALAQPYRFYLLKRAQDEYAAMDETNRAEVDALLQSCGMTPLLEAKLNRDIGRDNNLEVWL